MSDAAPDPMDKAYAQAEAVLSDEAARAERRARVLAAVAGEPASAPAASPPRASRFPWRRGGWLAAAGVAGLSVLLATRVYPPSSAPKPPPQPPAAEVRAPEARAVASPPAPAIAPRTPAPRSVPSATSSAPAGTPVAPHVTPAAPTPAPPAAPRVEEPPAAFAPAPIERPTESVVTARRRAETVTEAPPSRAPADEALSEAVVTRGSSKAQALGAAPADQATRLRAAAAGNRTAELKALLADGVRVDAADAEGETALMKSIEAGHPAAAALLRRAGADLDLENRAGRSARDMAKAKDDPKLNQALGLEPPPAQAAHPR